MEKKKPVLVAPVPGPFQFSTPTRFDLEAAIAHMMNEVSKEDKAYLAPHIKDTPKRVVRAYADLMSGVSQNPASVLRTKFLETRFNEMIVVDHIDFVSLCMHHLLPFHGTVAFAYIPNRYVVGLSKIPRMIEILSRRPQIQERLTRQIVDIFQENMKPRGCAALVEAWHGCCGHRGVRKPNAKMRTSALTGIFLTKPAVKQEFLTMALYGNPNGK